MADDHHRPQYHFLPPAHWMNDPNGLIQFRGDYHLFYQYDPHYPNPGAKHWGHAVSRDLVHWEHWPVALTPTPGGPDAGGCWSGCAVDHDGLPPSSIPASAPRSSAWRRAPTGCARGARRGQPVVAAPPKGSRWPVSATRASGARGKSGAWSSARDPGPGGTALLYRSPDLRHWEYLQPLLTCDQCKTGHMWECPDLFPLEHKHVLVVSPQPLRRAVYFVGAYRDDAFVPENRGEVDTGGHFYAPQTLLDDRNRRLMWGWLWEGRSKEAQAAAGWAGVMSLPRVLALGPNGAIEWAFPEELATLRGAGLAREGLGVASGERVVSADLGAAYEARVRYAPDGDEPPQAYGLLLRASPDGEEATRLAYEPATATPRWTARAPAATPRRSATSTPRRSRSRRGRGSTCTCTWTIR